MPKAAETRGPINQAERDEELVDRFAAAIKDLLAKDRCSEAPWQWDDPEAVTQFLGEMKVARAERDMVAVGMFAAFVWQHSPGLRAPGQKGGGR